MLDPRASSRHSDAMPNREDFLSGANIDFIEALYARYLEDPSSVDESWRNLFQRYGRDGKPIFSNGKAAARRVAPEAAPSRLAAVEQHLQARVDQTIFAFRLRGHLVAELDPLGRPRPPLEHVADLAMVSDRHFTPHELEQPVDSNGVFEQEQVRLADLLARLRRTYCHHIGVEYMHIGDSARRRWLQRQMEWTENRTAFSVDEQRRILTKLSYAEAFESFLHTKYVGAKRFSLDGGESLIPMIDAFLDMAGPLGVREVVIGMAHRGRLNVLNNVLGKSADEIFSEFEGPDDPKAYLNRGDVKYHQGFSSDYTTQAGQEIHLSLAFNPSHLEAVYPVVEGRVRAKQDRAEDQARKLCVPLVIHGDAAFPGQGVVAETLNLAGLPGYTVGGTVHIVINNQIGFTTEPFQARSAHYCTEIAKLAEAPIFHVNGDDPEACVHAMRLATQYRHQFNGDVVIDLVCFRRYGHNEGDEPTFTQPKMYELIRSHPTVRSLYAEQLWREGRLGLDEAERIKQKCLADFQAAHQRIQGQSRFVEPSFNQGLWRTYRGGPDRDTPDVDTGVELDRLKQLLRKMCAVPEGFEVHPKVKRLFETRLAMADEKQPLDWATAELLAFATLLADGYSVRLTGQDTERGTFSQRHAVLHDVRTGATWTPLQHLSDVQGNCTVLNSPLSELGCVGFEFGYSLDYPDALVAWEAQFGDFVNGAQIIIDQFISSSEDKWRRLSGLVLLLPHGYEGQGPEHSSARLERFLGLCAEDNMQVVNPASPAQYFHVLRRQVVRPWRKPLVVMTPKSLLRRPECVSPLSELASGRFQRFVPDRADVELAHVDRLLLCSGKVYWDLLAGRDAAKDGRIAIARVAQLYPLPFEAMKEYLRKMPSLREVFWVQEEPKNMGAWKYMIQPLQQLLADHPNKPRYGYIGRVESASPATGFHDTHVYEQKLIVEEAFRRS